MRADRCWDKPSTFETMNPGKFHTISSTVEAARILVTVPLRTGRGYRKARIACISVLEGNGDPPIAREAFLKAAEEAGVFIRPSR
ncbi:DUF982 domain-containing protein [Shinella sp.]|uniref:DUF982 domain-containing protein n=1 Tax=Shinella sp. TaxID=1870904 RepID=UPI003C7773F2